MLVKYYFSHGDGSAPQVHNNRSAWRAPSVVCFQPVDDIPQLLHSRRYYLRPLVFFVSLSNALNFINGTLCIFVHQFNLSAIQPVFCDRRPINPATSSAAA